MLSSKTFFICGSVASLVLLAACGGGGDAGGSPGLVSGNPGLVPAAVVDAPANTKSDIRPPDIELSNTPGTNLLEGWTAQQELKDRGTSDRPAMAYMHSPGNLPTLRMAWKGVNSKSLGGFVPQFDERIYEASMTSDVWSAQRRVEGIKSEFGPALAAIGPPGNQNGLLMAQKGLGAGFFDAESKQGLYFATDLGSGWSTHTRIPGVGSDRAPALANVAGQVYMVWKGIEGDNGLYWSRYRIRQLSPGQEFNQTSTGVWDAQQHIPGAATKDTPALVSVGNRLFVFWSAAGEYDRDAYWSSIDFSNANSTWSAPGRVHDHNAERNTRPIQAMGGLAAVPHGNGILIAWRGADDGSIFVSFWSPENGDLFNPYPEFSVSEPVRLPFATSTGPSLVQLADGSALMAWKGADKSNIFWAVRAPPTQIAAR